MSEGDWPKPDDTPVEMETEVEVEAEPQVVTPQAPEEDVLGVAQAREQLLAAVAALEKPAPEPELSDEEAEALALAEAIEAERRALDD
ncbi:hypothetical protein D3C72_2079930 [compost metagenome]